MVVGASGATMVVGGSGATMVVGFVKETGWWLERVHEVALDSLVASGHQVETCGG